MENKREQKNTIKDVYESSVFGTARKIIGGIYKRNKWIIYIELVITFLVSVFLSGFVLNLSKKAEGLIRDFTTLQSFGTGITEGFIIALIIFVFLNVMAYRACAMFHTEREVDEERNYDVSKENYYGSARKMDDEEKENAFTCGNFATMLDDFLGCEPGNPYKLYAVKKNYDINGNEYIVGAPGCGKSRCYVRNKMFQCIRRGDSMLVSDPKGELYRDFKKLAEAHGYTVKIFNADPRQIAHSDGCDFLGVIGDDDLMAQSFSATVIQNLIDDPDFWGDSEMNEMIFLTSYVASDINQVYPKTLAGVYQMLNQNTVADLEAIGEMIPNDHPARAPFNTWYGGDKTVKGNTHAGLQIHLQRLANKKIQKVTSSPNIDLTLPGREKCLYFVSMSDQDSSMKFVTALFFTLFFQENVNYADTHGGILPVKIKVILDEFKSIGRIPDFDTRISNMRSRGIDCSIITQSLGQLQQMYPDGVWESILDCCSTWILLRTNTKVTADYFSDRSGEQTVEDKGKRYTEQAGDMLKVHPEYQVTESHGRRYVYTSHELRTLPSDRMVLFISGHNAVELQKVDYSLHPMCKEIRKVEASEYEPQWVKDMTPAEKERMGLDKEIYAEKEYGEIKLCTEEDFLEMWTEEKEEALQRQLEREKKRSEERKKGVTQTGTTVAKKGTATTQTAQLQKKSNSSAKKQPQSAGTQTTVKPVSKFTPKSAKPLPKSVKKSTDEIDVRDLFS